MHANSLLNVNRRKPVYRLHTQINCVAVQVFRNCLECTDNLPTEEKKYSTVSYTSSDNSPRRAVSGRHDPLTVDETSTAEMLSISLQ